MRDVRVGWATVDGVECVVIMIGRSSATFSPRAARRIAGHIARMADMAEQQDHRRGSEHERAS